MTADNKPKAVHFGAGNIGRGFIGPLLVDSGYHVVFADVDKPLIERINRQHEYDVYILDKEGEDIVSVRDVSAVLSTNHDIVKEIADPATQIITTAVGVGILEKIASTIAKGLKERRTAGGQTLNIIACENVIGATSKLKKGVLDELDDRDKAFVEEYVGFPNCAVDRIVPPFEPGEHDAGELDVGVEGFYEWIVEESSLKGDKKPDLKGWKLTDNLTAYVERKLFTLNTGHAIAAYLGVLKGISTIDSAINDEQVHAVVRGAIAESGQALIRKHGFKQQEHEHYMDTVIERFQNPSVKDDVARVGRQPLRKLSREDRLVGPMYMAREFGVEVKHLPVGVGAALRYADSSDEQAKQLQDDIQTKGIETVITDVTGFDKGSDEHQKILEAYKSLDSFKNGD